MGLTRTQLAKELRVSYNAVRKAELSGRISALPDGTFDLEPSRTAWAANTRPGVSKVKTGPLNGTEPVEEVEARAAVAMVDRILMAQGFALKNLSYQQRAKICESVLKSRELEQKLNINDGRLIDAEVVASEIFELARQEREALRTWTAKVSPLIAAEFGIDQIKFNIVMERHVGQFLAKRSDPKLRRTRASDSAASVDGGVETGNGFDGERVGGPASEIEPEGSGGTGTMGNQPDAVPKEIMDALSSTSSLTRVAFMKGNQLGGTEAGNNTIGYWIDHTPGPILSVSPTVEAAKRSSKQRITPMIEEAPTLSAKVRESRSRDSGNTILAKEFPGGILVMTGANSAVGLRSMPARYLFLDEIDAYPADVENEGDPVSLAEARARNFRRRKVFLVSTPTIAGESRIEREYLASDQRKYFVPCPECDHFQVLQFKQLKWDKGKPETARYVCDECGSLLGNEHKTEMLTRGEWRPTAESKNGTAGFHLSSLYSPVGWLSWTEVAQRWEAAQGSPEDLKTFVNGVLGETWNIQGDAPDHQRLMSLREDYPRRRIPPQGLITIAAADVQLNGIYVVVVSFGRDRQSWVIEALALDGDTSDPDRGAFARLAELYDADWADSFGGFRKIDAFGIDSGFRTNAVYNWARNRPLAFALKGIDGWSRAAIASPSLVDVDVGGKRISNGATLWNVGTWALKSSFYSDLRKLRVAEGAEQEPPGCIHHGQFLDENYFKQITSEFLIDEKFKGRTRKVWKERGDNHFLDCNVYVRALADYIGVNRWQPHEWNKVSQVRGPKVEKPPLPQEPNVSAPPAPRPPQVLRQRIAHRSSYMD